MKYIHPETGLEIAVYLEQEKETYELATGEKKQFIVSKKLTTICGQQCFPVQGDDISVIEVITHQGKIRLIKKER